MVRKRRRERENCKMQNSPLAQQKWRAQTCFAFNIDVMKFYRSGNDWSTRASERERERRDGRSSVGGLSSGRSKWRFSSIYPKLALHCSKWTLRVRIAPNRVEQKYTWRHEINPLVQHPRLSRLCNRALVSRWKKWKHMKRIFEYGARLINARFHHNQC